MLRHLVRSERPLRVLVLGTYRDTELDARDQLAGLLADLQRDTCTERMRVGGLDDRAITALLEATVAHPPEERTELGRMLGAQTAGNPFFLRELLAHMAASGAHSSAGVTAADLKTPEGLRHVIDHRVAQLGFRLQVCARQR